MAAVLCACVTQPGPPALPSVQWRAVAFSDLPGWATDRLDDAWRPLLASCSVLLARATATLGWRDACTAAATAREPDDAAAREFFERHFTAYEVSTADGSASALITGYYEPLLHGSRSRDERYRYPLYAPPDDLLTVDLSGVNPELADKRMRGRLEGKRIVPYWTRADIEAGKAAAAGKELFYVDDPLDAFFLHVQGSGRVELPDASRVRIGYADQNGWPYRSIGRVLVERGELPLELVSMQSIRHWAHEHPLALPALLAENPSYVFFREVVVDPAAAIDGPIGTLGVPLQAGRAIAVDTRFIPLGAPVFVATTRPSTGQPLERLTLAQDTGGAIRGPLRGDFFWGFGGEAEREAGRMRQDGRLWLLWPKNDAPPR
jgi:membrane-bound lytic murein transglycosylase A